MSIIVGIIRQHEAAKPISGEDTRTSALWFRDQLLLRMMACNPLRNRNYREMTWKDDNSGNLYRCANGSWRLRFRPSDFKNEKGAAKAPYDVEILPALWPHIENYLFQKRRILLGGRQQDNVFVTKDGKKFNHRSLSVVIFRLTHAYQSVLPEAGGFRSHAVRHIVATAWLRANPDDFLTVALILHDKLATVMENYAHLSATDGLNRYGKWVGRIIGE